MITIEAEQYASILQKEYKTQQDYVNFFEGRMLEYMANVGLEQGMIITMPPNLIQNDNKDGDLVRTLSQEYQITKSIHNTNELVIDSREAYDGYGRRRTQFKKDHLTNVMHYLTALGKNFAGNDLTSFQAPNGIANVFVMYNQPLRSNPVALPITLSFAKDMLEVSSMVKTLERQKDRYHREIRQFTPYSVANYFEHMINEAPYISNGDALYARYDDMPDAGVKFAHAMQKHQPIVEISMGLDDDSDPEHRIPKWAKPHRQNLNDLLQTDKLNFRLHFQTNALGIESVQFLAFDPDDVTGGKNYAFISIDGQPLGTGKALEDIIYRTSLESFQPSEVGHKVVSVDSNEFLKAIRALVLEYSYQSHGQLKKMITEHGTFDTSMNFLTDLKDEFESVGR